MTDERKIITEFIELYRDSPCLWDPSCDEYKDPAKKRNAWQVLSQKLKKFDAEANEISAKRKIENLKSSYLRELKKVKESKKRTGPAAGEVHRPNLWYYEQMSFLDKKTEAQRKGVDSFCEEESLTGPVKRKKESRSNTQQILDTAQKLLAGTTTTDSFAAYVGGKLDQIQPGQRDIAEKLISDVLFLAKTNNLTFDTKIEIPSKPLCTHYPETYHLKSSPSPQTPFASPTNTSNQNLPLIQSQHTKLVYSPSATPASPYDLTTQDESIESFQLPLAQFSSSSFISNSTPSPSHCQDQLTLFQKTTIKSPPSCTPSSSASNPATSPTESQEQVTLYEEGAAGEILKKLLILKEH